MDNNASLDPSDAFTVNKKQKLNAGNVSFCCGNHHSAGNSSPQAQALPLSLANYSHKPKGSVQSSSDSKGRDDVDQLLASDMYNLSVNERNDAYEDVHGTSQPIQETDEFVVAKLKSLEEELNKIPDARKSAYIQAKQLSSEYVESDKLRLMFLRSKRFDAKEAADQMVNLFDMKRSLFGSKSLGRPIIQSDLNSDDKKALMAGGMQILQGKDNIGRAVHLMMYNEMRGSAKENCRALFYNIMTFLEDEEIQKNGFALIYWWFGTKLSVSKLDIERVDLMTKLGHTLPFLTTALHYCGPGSGINPILKLALALTVKRSRVRFRAHLGSPLECIYALSTYGISRHILPIDENYNLLRTQYHSWLEERRGIEDGMGTISKASAQPMDTHAKPQPEDVLLGGTGKEFSWHPGNVLFRDLLEKYADEYNGTNSKAIKRSACQSVVLAIRETGGRLLLRGEDKQWHELDNDVAQLKVSRAFRNRRRYVKEA